MTDLSRDYMNSAFIPDGDTFYSRWQAEAAAFRGQMAKRSRLNIAYGPGARQAFDLFQPEGMARGLMVFVHGGYWLACGREDYSHLAAGAVARGWACALPSYTLAPQGRIAAMTAEIGQAVRAASAMVTGPVVVTGHSAGGHLSARMGCADQQLSVARVVPISPLADLAPLMQTEMNATLQIDAAEAETESPAHLLLRAEVKAHVWVGGQERPAFLWQARTLSEAWNCPWTVEAGKHHFDVIDGLSNPASALMETCLGGL
jgi:acetyl esterase/lipase